MRCPKCQYISFDSGDKCRNCGYEFSLSPEPRGPLGDDLRIQTGDEAEGPLSVPDTIPPRPITESFDLPLFNDRNRDDRPLVSAPAVPRAPLAVRKQAPAPAPAPARSARRAAAVEEPRLDLDLALDDEEDAEEAPPVRVAAAPRTPRVVERSPTASAAARLLAAAIDFVLLAAIDLAVLHYTLKIVRLEYLEIAALPLAPFVSFLLILNGAYFTAFTAAGGQSIGKMAARIRVVPSDPDAWSDRVPLGQSVLRAVAYFLSALPFGLGFLPGLIGAEKRALHDRIAHTRVVRAESAE